LKGAIVARSTKVSFQTCNYECNTGFKNHTKEIGTMCFMILLSWPLSQSLIFIIFRLLVVYESQINELGVHFLWENVQKSNLSIINSSKKQVFLNDA